MSQKHSPRQQRAAKTAFGGWLFRRLSTIIAHSLFFTIIYLKSNACHQDQVFGQETSRHLDPQAEWFQAWIPEALMPVTVVSQTSSPQGLSTLKSNCHGRLFVKTVHQSGIDCFGLRVITARRHWRSSGLTTYASCTGFPPSRALRLLFRAPPQIAEERYRQSSTSYGKTMQAHVCSAAGGPHISLEHTLP